MCVQIVKQRLAMNVLLTNSIAKATAWMRAMIASDNATRTALTVALAKMVFEPDSSEAAAADDATSRVPGTLDEFLASVERRAFRMAELALGHREDAFDVVQDTMIKLLQYQHKPAAEWSPLFWSILRRQLTDKHRRNSVKKRFMQFFGKRDTDEKEIDPIDLVADPFQDPLRKLSDNNSFQALSKALQTLPTRQRECFLLRELQGLSVHETAAAMGCSEGSVKTHLSRAISALKLQLEDWQ
jgi:RNA polymerase sigma-70 factor, ECF subfamily